MSYADTYTQQAGERIAQANAHAERLQAQLHAAQTGRPIPQPAPPAGAAPPTAPQLTPEQTQLQQRLATFVQTDAGKKAYAESEALMMAALQKWEQAKQQPQAQQAGGVTAEQFQKAMEIIKRQGDELAQLKKSLGETN